MMTNLSPCIQAYLASIIASIALLERMSRWSEFIQFQKRNEVQLTKKVNQYFQAQGRRLVRQLNATNINSAPDLLDWRREALAMQALLRRTFQAAYITGYKRADKQVAQIQRDAREQAIGEEDEEDVNLDADLIAIQGALEAVDDTLDQLTTLISLETRVKIQNVLAKGLEEGQSIAQIAQGIQAVFESSKVRATMIARTEIIRALNQGARQAYTDSGFLKDINQDFEVRVTGTGKPRKDGSVQSILGPPAHPNCVCALALDPDTGILEWLLSTKPCPICIDIEAENQRLINAA